jgi:DNA mismatch repair protein MutL
MTSRIQRLDPTTIHRIAAGEVIERPASVLKELLDNALDAGSTRLDILLRNGGRQLIQVTDNGCGMSAEDAMLAVQRFTTSKIRHIDDLQTLTTLGFRGEALPSIALVADLTITTRPADQTEGVLVQSHAHSTPQQQPIACPVGTRVQVGSLFQNVPVRLHALKTVTREVQLMQELVTHYALAYPQVMFHVKHDERRLLFAQTDMHLLSRIAMLMGEEVAGQMLPVTWHNLDLSIQGAVSVPGLTRATRQRHYIWVNGRPVRSPLVSAAVERAYGAQLSPGRHPIVALDIRLAPALLDVNIHPRKAEVKFLHERSIFAGVEEAVTQAMHGILSTASLPAVPEGEQDVWPTTSLASAQVQEDAQAYASTRQSASVEALQSFGQLGRTFLVASSAQGLLVLDQHAAHESLLYAQLLSGTAASEELAEPWLLALGTSQAQLLMSLQPALTALGLQCEAFGQGMVLVRTVPAVLHALLQPGSCVEAMQEALQRIHPHTAPEAWREHLAAALACRTAIRAGDPLDADQIAMLLEAVAQQRLAYTCPHGRPTCVTLSLAELERRFLRER